MEYSKNAYLNMEEMKQNAQIIMTNLINKGWSINAISGMLGNMQSESTINPGIWQSLNEGNMSGGYGLVQWTPASKFINWANSEGLSITTIDGQLQRISYEIQNNLQWIATSGYNFSFYDFTQSTQTPRYLASAFLKNYERAGVEVEQNRRNQADFWYSYLTGELPPLDPDDPFDIDKAFFIMSGRQTNMRRR